MIESVFGKYQEGINSWKPHQYSDNKSRYLWTDAFGVCNFITLFYETGLQSFLVRAESLINDVHEILGRHRPQPRQQLQGDAATDDESKKPPRLNGATKEHPTLGGLRIGKIDPEGTPDGDGQYFHYLTKWAFALNRMTIATNDIKYNQWAVELIQGIHSRFVIKSSDRYRMYWKMSIDLTHPHVKSEGNLDPFDGFVTYRLVAECAKSLECKSHVLEKEIGEMAQMVQTKYKHYRSSDELDLGEALWISHWYSDEEWADFITKQSLQSLERLWEFGPNFHGSPLYRLAFREFGTTIGVQVNKAAGEQWKERVEKLHTFWRPHLWSRDKDITPMMYCTSLVPGVFYKDFPHNKC